jgi:hypothetical protein
MRRLAVLFALLVSASLCWAHGLTDRVPDARELADLEAKAAVASPNEQPYIYAELVHSMTEVATAQFQAGDDAQASASLKEAQSYAGKIQMSLLRDARKLKNAEILIRHTAFRLRELLTGASLDDRPALEATIQQLNKVQSEMMTQIFRR